MGRRRRQSLRHHRSALGSGPFKPWDRGARFGVDLRDLGSAGWAVLFPRDGDPAVRQALAPLLALRQRQAEARRAGLYRELHGEEGYRSGETADDLLVRQGAGPGVADPGKLPYYLLLVGGPEEIPFEVQLQLDLQYGVGRIGFDSPDDYARYAESVVAAEEGHSPAAVLGLWTAFNDARSYAVFGDPAVRLPVVREPVPPGPVPAP